jgi:hypothetical protein
MIALDIHFYLKHGSIKGAIQSMFDFLATFGKYLNQVEAVKVLSFAFYLTLIGRFGQVIVPDYVLRYFDIGFDLSREYYVGYLDILVLAYHEHTNEEAEADLFQEESRDMITRVEGENPIETLEDDTFYVKSL